METRVRTGSTENPTLACAIAAPTYGTEGVMTKRTMGVSRALFGAGVLGCSLWLGACEQKERAEVRRTGEEVSSRAERTGREIVSRAERAEERLAPEREVRGGGPQVATAARRSIADA